MKKYILPIALILFAVILSLSIPYIRDIIDTHYFGYISEPVPYVEGDCRTQTSGSTDPCIATESPMGYEGAWGLVVPILAITQLGFYLIGFSWLIFLLVRDLRKKLRGI